MKARVVVTLKNGVLDPQGEAINNALKSLHFVGVSSVRQGKVFDVVLDDMTQDRAHATLEKMCDELLANTVIENYAINIELGQEHEDGSRPVTRVKP